MELEENEESASFVPLIARFDGLDHVLLLLEEKLNNSLSPVRDLRSMDGNKEFMTLSSALEEVECKGTLIHRLTLLENRVLQLSLEMDERNTSKSSSSTAQVSDVAIPVRRGAVKFNRQQMQDPVETSLYLKEGASSADSSVKESSTVTAQHKKKPKRHWMRLLRLRC